MDLDLCRKAWPSDYTVTWEGVCAKYPHRLVIPSVYPIGAGIETLLRDEKKLADASGRPCRVPLVLQMTKVAHTAVCDVPHSYWSDEVRRVWPGKGPYAPHAPKLVLCAEHMFGPKKDTSRAVSSSSSVSSPSAPAKHPKKARKPLWDKDEEKLYKKLAMNFFFKSLKYV
jgi:hypothetical protein